jgi:hypothetical protein
VGDVIQAVEHLPSKLEALCSNPSTIKKKKSQQKDFTSSGYVITLVKNEI